MVSALAVVCLLLGLASFALLVRGRFLRTLRLVRHDELAAQVLGVNVARVKANVFTVGSAYSALGGVLLAYYVGVLAPESGGVNASLESLAMVIIGGAGALLGPVVGAAGVQWLFAIAGGAAHYELLVYGLGNIANDFWLEQLVKRGVTNWQVPGLTVPALTLPWLIVLALIVALPVGVALGIVSYTIYLKRTARVMLVDPSPEEVAGKPVPLRRRRRGAR